MIQTIIGDWGGPFIGGGFSYTLTAADFDTNAGKMTWFGALAWVNYLNVTNYQGYSDWRLPNIGPGGTNPGSCGGACYPSNSGAPISSSEWWELFFNEIGGVEAVPLSTTHNSNYTLFTNVLGGWGGNGQTIDPANDFVDTANKFDTNSNQQREFTGFKTFAWVVRAGLSMNSPPPMAHLVLSPSGMLTFGNQSAGKASSTQKVKISSTGTGPANIAIDVSGDFVQTNDCPVSLAPGATCMVGVAFNPSTVDARAGRLTISAGTTYTLALSGTGTLGVSLSSNTPTVTVGVPANLTWTSVSGAACTAGGGAWGDGWTGTLAASGTAAITETTTGLITYTINCTADSQSAQSSVQVFNNPKPSGGGSGGLDLLSVIFLFGVAMLSSVRRFS